MKRKIFIFWSILLIITLSAKLSWTNFFEASHFMHERLSRGVGEIYVNLLNIQISVFGGGLPCKRRKRFKQIRATSKASFFFFYLLYIRALSFQVIPPINSFQSCSMFISGSHTKLRWHMNLFFLIVPFLLQEFRSHHNFPHPPTGFVFGVVSRLRDWEQTQKQK